MKNTKLPMLVLGALMLGAGGSIAVQAFAQTPPVQPSAVVSNQIDQNIDQKDAQGNDVETNDDQESKVTTSVKVTEVQAKQIALSANPGTTVVKIELDQEDSKVAYEVTLSNQMEVKIDANSGTILESKIDKEDGKGDEKDNGSDQKDTSGKDMETNDGPEND